MGLFTDNWSHISTHQCPLWKRDIIALRRRTRLAHNTFKAHCTTAEIPSDSTIIGIKRIHSDHISPQHLQHEQSNVDQLLNTPTSDFRTPQFRPVDRQYWEYLYKMVMQRGSVFSDGSFGGGKASYAIVIQPDQFATPMENIPEEELLWKAGTVTGHSKYDLNSYRAEFGRYFKCSGNYE